MIEPKVAREVAEQEFDRWIDKMGLARKADPSALDDDDKAGLLSTKNTLLDAIMNGSLVLDGEGQFVFTPTMGGDAMTFHEPTGASYIAMDQAKSGATVQRMFKAMTDMTRSAPGRFASMKQRDLDVCLSITTLFFTKR